MKAPLRLIALLVAIGWSLSAPAQVMIGDDGTLNPDSQTEYLLDDEVVSYSRYLAEAAGYTAEYEVEEADDELTTGRLRRIHLRNNLKGLVTSIDPLTVLNIPVVVTDDTKLRNFPAGGLADIRVGDSLAVSGFPAPDSSVMAFRLGYSPNGFERWRLSGFIERVTESGLVIGPQEVEVPATISLADCEEGGFALIKARPLDSFVPGQVLDTVESVRCADHYPFGDGFPAAIEGFITDLLDDRTFMIGSVTVVTNDETRFANGDPSDIKIGVKVVARGVVEPGTRTLNAKAIKFRELRVEATGPLSADNYRPDVSLTVLGIEFAIVAHTRIDPMLTQGPLPNAVQVEVRGYFDSSGNAYASRVKVIGEANRDDVELRGHVSAFNQPGLTAGSVSIDSSESEFEIAGHMVEADDFFSVLKIGLVVEIDDASFDSSTGTVSGGELSLRDRDGPPHHRGISVEAEGPVTPDDYVPGRSITIVGITFAITPHSIDVPLGDMQGPVFEATQVHVRGVLFGDRLVARRIERKGPAQYDNVSLSGPLTRLASPEFGVLGAEVDTSESTFTNFDSLEAFFAAADLGERVRVEEARYNAENGMISGGTIELREKDDDLPTRRRVGAVAPVSPDEIVIGESVSVMGIRFMVTDGTRDPDGVIRNGLTEPMQLRVLGAKIISDDMIIATHVSIVGPPDLDNTALRGPVEAIAEPTVQILGVTLDVSDSTFEDEETDDHMMSLETFFKHVKVGSLVQVRHASLDPAGPLLTGGHVELEDWHRRLHDHERPDLAAAGNSQTNASNGTSSAVGFGVGTVSQSDAELMFRESFD